NLFDDPTFGPGRCEQSDGSRQGHPWETQFSHRWKLGRGNKTRGIRHRKNPRLAGALEFEQLPGHAWCAHWNLSAHQIGDEGTGASIRHLHDVGYSSDRFE